MQYQGQPYGQVSGNQGGYYPQQPYSQPPPPQQQQYQQPYLDPNIPMGQPMGQQYNQPYNQPQPYVQYQNVPQQGIIITTGQPLSSADGLRFPTDIICPYCRQRGTTVITTRVGDSTICASIIILFLCWPLFWLPCVLDDCKDIVHVCCNCRQIVGRKKYDMC